jgi:uncharacterized protein
VATGNLMMFFPISGVWENPFYLVFTGFLIGVLGGFFGVGGSFLAAPALFATGMPMNYVVGTDLAHIVGKSIVAAKQHRALGNIDLKLAGIMVIGTLLGSESGVQTIEMLKKKTEVDLVVGVVSITVFLLIALFTSWESWRVIRSSKQAIKQLERNAKTDMSGFTSISKWVQRIPIGPRVRLEHSGIESISLWAILIISFIGGYFSGFLGGGAGYIRMPCMVYLLGIPTHIAIGTDLFEIIISAGYGSFRHAMHGNVDILVALVMQTGATIGARIGAVLTQYFSGPWIRLSFAVLPLIGAIVILQKLLHIHL